MFFDLVCKKSNEDIVTMFRSIYTGQVGITIDSTPVCTQALRVLESCFGSPPLGEVQFMLFLVHQISHYFSVARNLKRNIIPFGFLFIRSF